MSDYVNHKEYKLPNGRTVTADFDEWGRAMVTIQAMDALFDIFNSSDVVEVVRCKDCKYGRYAVRGNYKYKLNLIDCNRINIEYPYIISPNDYCSYGERKEE